MNAFTFDRLKFTKTLQSAGIPVEQSEAIAIAFRDATGDVELATKKDLALAVAELKIELSSQRGELNTIKWMVGALVALSVANFAKQYF